MALPSSVPLSINRGSELAWGCWQRLWEAGTHGDWTTSDEETCRKTGVNSHWLLTFTDIVQGEVTFLAKISNWVHNSDSLFNQTNFVHWEQEVISFCILEVFKWCLVCSKSQTCQCTETIIMYFYGWNFELTTCTMLHIHSISHATPFQLDLPVLVYC